MPDAPTSPVADTKPGSNDPLHGITLKMMLTSLVEQLGWEDMSARIRINCFAEKPSMSSSLRFLRKTPWARKKVEALYVRIVSSQADPSRENHNARQPHMPRTNTQPILLNHPERSEGKDEASD